MSKPIVLTMSDYIYNAMSALSHSIIDTKSHSGWGEGGWGVRAINGVHAGIGLAIIQRHIYTQVLM